MKKLENITISDIAKLSGVGVGTVSRIINNSGPVSEETRLKVQRVIDRFNYEPNALARGLVKGKSASIGLLIPDFLNPFYAEVIKGIESITAEHGFAMFLCYTGYDVEKEEYYIEEMHRRRTNGLIILSSFVREDLLNSSSVRSMHLVGIQTDIAGMNVINTDDHNAMRKVTNHLIELGHKRIAFLGYQYEVTHLNGRYQGYRNEMEAHGIDILGDYSIEVQSLKDLPDVAAWGYSNTIRLLSLQNPPTAIQCINDNMALGCYMAANEMGLKIPDDISISGFDNIHFSRLMSPQLTTVNQPAFEMGRAAATILCEEIENNVRNAQNVVLPTELIIRGSTAPPKSGI